MKKSKPVPVIEPAEPDYMREDLFVSIVNRHQDRQRAAENQAAQIQDAKNKGMVDGAFALAGIAGLAAGLVFTIVQFL